MARKPKKLKVFRTAVGFRDAYVAAPSRAAALRAWGTEKDLFARGAAEEVTDAELGAEALEKPGDVVYRTRGGLKEQVAALGKLPARKAAKAATKPVSAKAAPATAAPEPAKPPIPRPSRAEVEEAEAAIAQHEREQAEAEHAMQERERALAAERDAMESRLSRERKQLQGKLEAARAAYREALDRWEP
ncbi:type IV secretory pathway VirB10-like protein [Novosphingobium chloroacetimidivorans]|uniref:Type IV secretory pathway VirB10-like protein n=1 Tax=Novosphingobium chloroacetimidivorans TaxID=1428314 RepID=A0A7W7NUV6_9SPHN|nr:hypothetical protein [Novosphingobium chloroacetimidivorans]MBB4857903.1 type IV secretory pathway VirB10-like protein [Novosphingobium chloroacetimidivorans]